MANTSSSGQQSQSTGTGQAAEPKTDSRTRTGQDAEPKTGPKDE